MNPKVSIIVSFYNSERTLERCLAGILGQSYDNIELVLIDDGSTDGGRDIAQRYARSDRRVQLIQKENTGVSDSRNVGLDAITGDWVYFADADDWIAPHTVQTFVDAAMSPSCDLAVSDFYRVKGERVAYKKGPSGGLVSCGRYARFMARRPANFYYTSLWNKVFRRSIIEEHGMRFDTGMQFGEDHVFILEYLHFVDRVALISQALYYYVDNEGSLVHQGLNPAGIVKMKYNTYLPYLRLFDKLGVYRRCIDRPKLYKFIFWPATDNFVKQGAEPLDTSHIPG